MVSTKQEITFNSENKLLIQAVKSGSVSITASLLKRGLNPNLCDTESNTLLHIAIENGYLEVSELLIKGGSNLEYFNNNGLAPIHEACKLGDKAHIKLLFESGANLYKASDSGLNAFDYALQNSKCMQEYLISLMQDSKTVEESNQRQVSLSSMHNSDSYNARKDLNQKTYARRNTTNLYNHARPAKIDSEPSNSFGDKDSPNKVYSKQRPSFTSKSKSKDCKSSKALTLISQLSPNILSKANHPNLEANDKTSYTKNQFFSQMCMLDEKLEKIKRDLKQNTSSASIHNKSNHIHMPGSSLGNDDLDGFKLNHTAVNMSSNHNIFSVTQPGNNNSMLDITPQQYSDCAFNLISSKLQSNSATPQIYNTSNLRSSNGRDSSATHKAYKRGSTNLNRQDFDPKYDPKLRPQKENLSKSLNSCNTSVDHNNNSYDTSKFGIKDKSEISPPTSSHLNRGDLMNQNPIQRDMGQLVHLSPDRRPNESKSSEDFSSDPIKKSRNPETHLDIKNTKSISKIHSTQDQMLLNPESQFSGFTTSMSKYAVAPNQTVPSILTLRNPEQDTTLNKSRPDNSNLESYNFPLQYSNILYSNRNIFTNPSVKEANYANIPTTQSVTSTTNNFFSSTVTERAQLSKSQTLFYHSPNSSATNFKKNMTNTQGNSYSNMKPKPNACIELEFSLTGQPKISKPNFQNKRLSENFENKSRPLITFNSYPNGIDPHSKKAQKHNYGEILYTYANYEEETKLVEKEHQQKVELSGKNVINTQSKQCQVEEQVIHQKINAKNVNFQEVLDQQITNKVLNQTKTTILKDPVQQSTDTFRINNESELANPENKEHIAKKESSMSNFNSEFASISKAKGETERKKVGTNNFDTYNIEDEPCESKELYEILVSLGLESHYRSLIKAGFDDVSIMCDQMKTEGNPISHKMLKSIGMNITGDRSRLILKLEELALNFQFEIPKVAYFNSKSNEDYVSNLKSMESWFTALKVEKYTKRFVSSGFTSLELLLLQNLTK